jgi:hypothetical protein
LTVFKPLMLAALAMPLAVMPVMAQQIQTGGAPSDPNKTTTVRPPVNSAQTGTDPSQATPPMARNGAAGAGTGGGGGGK